VPKAKIMPKISGNITAPTAIKKISIKIPLLSPV
jgi:hypothetical protein